MSDTSYERYYSKGKYEAAIGALAVACVFLFVAIGSLFLDHFDIDFIGLEGWGIYMFIPAFFVFLGGFEQIYTNYKYKRAIKAAIAERNYQGTLKLENLALEVGIKPSDVPRVLLDLREKQRKRV